MKKRNDATPPSDVHGLVRIFPFIMQRRCDSLVYYKFSLDVSKAVQLVKKLNKSHNPNLDHNLRVFEVLLAAFARLIAERPKLNRFIMNYETWQRNELSFNFIVKEDYTDESPEHTAILKVKRDMDLFQIANLANKEIEKGRTPGLNNETDKLVDKYLKFPKWFVALLIKFFKHLDRKGKLPATIRDMDGLHVSAFIANLGSISLPSSPLHHLYEWGTTSIFITMGKLKRNRVLGPGETKTIQDTIDIGVTIDERIADGMYIIRSMHLLQKILDDPNQLLHKPNKLEYIPNNHKEYKKMVKARKNKK